MIKNFGTKFIGWAFILAAVLLWSGWALSPHQVGEYFQASDFPAIGENVWFWIWMYRIHIFGWVTMAIAIFAFVSMTGKKPFGVLIIPGAGKVIMISHGEFRTVYANLKEVYVKKGDQVKKGQELGVLLSLENSKLSEAHFEIWKITSKGMHTENPASWLISR